MALYCIPQEITNIVASSPQSDLLQATLLEKKYISNILKYLIMLMEILHKHMVNFGLPL